jgi:hypothetical protein
VSENAYLEKKTVEALRRYRDAFAAVENLEREEIFARRALTSILPDLSCALLEEGAPSIRRNLFRGGACCRVQRHPPIVAGDLSIRNDPPSLRPALFPRRAHRFA